MFKNDSVSTPRGSSFYLPTKHTDNVVSSIEIYRINQNINKSKVEPVTLWIRHSCASEYKLLFTYISMVECRFNYFTEEFKRGK